jgi:WD40-like Beta Propeller Repeat
MVACRRGQWPQHFAASDGRSLRPLVAVGIALACLVALLSAQPAQAAFPGANGRLVFEVFDDDANTTLSDALPGGRVRRLTRIPRWCIKREAPDSPYWSDERPRYSPDGNLIAYAHEDDCRGDFRREVKLMWADGSHRRTLLGFRDSSRGYFEDGMHPAFSRDGKRIIFIGGNPSQAGAVRLWIIDARSGRVLRRPQLPTALYGTNSTYPVLDWSPSGRAALGLVPPGTSDHRGIGIFTGRPGASFSHYRRITRTPERDALHGADVGADWSPSGTSMLFERFRFCSGGEDADCDLDVSDEEDGVSDVYQAFTKGRIRVRRLTRGGFSEEPVFSPNGLEMAYDADGGISIRSLAGGRARVAVKDGATPNWQPVTGATRFR